MQGPRVLSTSAWYAAITFSIPGVLLSILVSMFCLRFVPGSAPLAEQFLADSVFILPIQDRIAHTHEHPASAADLSPMKMQGHTFRSAPSSL